MLFSCSKPKSQIKPPVRLFVSSVSLHYLFFVSLSGSKTIRIKAQSIPIFTLLLLLNTPDDVSNHIQCDEQVARVRTFCSSSFFSSFCQNSDSSKCLTPVRRNSQQGNTFTHPHSAAGDQVPSERGLNSSKYYYALQTLFVSLGKVEKVLFQTTFPTLPPSPAAPPRSMTQRHAAF